MDHFFYRTLFTLLAMFTSVNAYADYCDNKSPDHIKNGDEYFETHETKPLTKKQRSSIVTMFIAIKGRLKGENIISECKKSKSSSTQKNIGKINYAEFHLQPNGEISIKMNTTYMKNRGVRDDTLNYFSLNDPFIIQKSTKSSLSVSRKWRSFNGSRTSSLREELITIKVNKKTLTIDTKYYMNGYYISSSKIKLHP